MFGGKIKHRDAAAGKDTVAGRGMPPHHHPLVLGQRPLLQQDAIRNRDLADIMQGSRGFHQVGDLLAASHQPGQRAGPGSDPCHVMPGVLVAEFACRAQPLDDFPMRLAKLPSSGIHDPFERIRPRRLIADQEM